MFLGVISQCGFAFGTLQFDQEDNIPGHSFERRAYYFFLKATRVFPILDSQSRQESERFANHNPHKKVKRDLTEKSIILMVLTEVLS